MKININNRKNPLDELFMLSAVNAPIYPFRKEFPLTTQKNAYIETYVKEAFFANDATETTIFGMIFTNE